jgi:hypothetical protein
MLAALILREGELDALASRLPGQQSKKLVNGILRRGQYLIRFLIGSGRNRCRN